MKHQIDLASPSIRLLFALEWWNTLNLVIPTSGDLLCVLGSLKDQIRLLFFIKIVVTICWSIYAIKNNIILWNIFALVHQCKLIFKHEFSLVILREKEKYEPKKNHS
jgi:hypothetical protein